MNLLNYIFSFGVHLIDWSHLIKHFLYKSIKDSLASRHTSYKHNQSNIEITIYFNFTFIKPRLILIDFNFIKTKKTLFTFTPNQPFKSSGDYLIRVYHLIHSSTSSQQSTASSYSYLLASCCSISNFIIFFQFTESPQWMKSEIPHQLMLGKFCVFIFLVFLIPFLIHPLTALYINCNLKFWFCISCVSVCGVWCVLVKNIQMNAVNLKNMRMSMGSRDFKSFQEGICWENVLQSF